MATLRRKPTNKARSVRAHNRGVHRTHATNLQIMRGGYRL